MREETRMTPDQLLSKYPAYEMEKIDRLLSEALAGFHKKLIVLDDDPTGVQTVHDIYVLTDYDVDSLKTALKDEQRMFFILTNSRSLSLDATITMHREIAENIAEAAKATGVEYVIISRGDSTMRGHYPAEPEALREVLTEKYHQRVDGEIICPFFAEGGRYTDENIHYLVDGGYLLPVGESEFAKDKTFGYKSSHLGDWIEEKTNGCYKSADVTYISIAELRNVEIDAICGKLMQINDFGKVVLNAVSYGDLKVFTIALYKAMAAGKTFLLRTAAGIVKIMGGNPDKPLLERAELVNTTNQNGGLIVVGSHVSKTTAQLERLHQCSFIQFVEINQHLVVDDEKFEAELKRVKTLTAEYIAKGITVAVYTRRDRFDLNTGSKEDELKMAVKISDGVTSVVSDLSIRPNFIIGKGGITSSEIGTKGLGVKKALVMGQILPGIPVWLTGPESKFPDMPYVIFPGNVGSEDALKEAVEKMQVM